MFHPLWSNPSFVVELCCFTRAHTYTHTHIHTHTHTHIHMHMHTQGVEEEEEDESEGEDVDSDEDEEEEEGGEEEGGEEGELSYDERHQYRSGRSYGADTETSGGLPRVSIPTKNMTF